MDKLIKKIIEKDMNPTVAGLDPKLDLMSYARTMISQVLRLKVSSSHIPLSEEEERRSVS